MPTTADKRDYYEVLGVDRAASRDAIKQAYRRLALRYHPDRNAASDAAAKFREIAEAYAVLSDDAKRREYDATGHAGVSERWSAEDLMRDFQFGDFFGGRFSDLFGIFGDVFGGRIRPAGGATRGLDLRYDLELTLEEAARGGDRVIQMTRSEQCPVCHGTGAKPGTTPMPCADCGGTGQKQQVRETKGMKVVTLTTCERCRGRGQRIDAPCQTCEGSGYHFVPHTLKVQIPPGVDDGMVVRLAGQGEAHAGGGPSGDLLIRTHLRPHPLFQRRGDHLYTAAFINLPEAALGTKTTVPDLGGKAIKVTVPPGTQSGTSLRLAGHGMPRLGGRGKGDLYVIVDVRTPTNLTAEQKGLLEEFAKIEATKMRERKGRP